MFCRFVRQKIMPSIGFFEKNELTLPFDPIPGQAEMVVDDMIGADI